MPSAKLRQDTVKTLPFAGSHASAQCVYWDATLRCFGVRIYASGQRTYVCSYRVQSRKRLARLGRVDVLTLDQARKKAQAYLARVASQEDPQSVVEETRVLKTTAELCAAYIAKYAKPKKITWEADESFLRRLILPKFGTRLAVALLTADLEAIHAEVGIEHPYAANNFLGVVRKMYNWAAVAGLVPRNHRNPAVGITRFRERKRRRFITTAEMPRFVRALEQEPNDYARHALWLLLLTGLRCKELLCAKWENIDWDEGTLFIGLTKNGEPLLAPLTSDALTRLRSMIRIQGNPHIICGQKPGAHLTGVGEPLRRALKRAGLENIRVHDIRRTVGSWLAQSGVSLHLIGDVLNHRDPKTTAGYAFFQTQQRREVLANHGQRVFSLSPESARLPALQSSVESMLEILPPPNSDQGMEHAATVPVFTSRTSHYFRRETLYELIWTTPVSEVAAKIGVSDVALAKLCRRAGIPTPSRGYWGRVSAGEPLGRAALPVSPAGLPELLRIRGRRR